MWWGGFFFLFFPPSNLPSTLNSIANPVLCVNIWAFFIDNHTLFIYSHTLRGLFIGKKHPERLNPPVAQQSAVLTWSHCRAAQRTHCKQGEWSQHQAVCYVSSHGEVRASIFASCYYFCVGVRLTASIGLRKQKSWQDCAIIIVPSEEMHL